MSRPLLLIVDGESLRTPSLASLLEGDGWDLRWHRSADSTAFLQDPPFPSLVLLNPASAGDSGYALVRGLRERQPGLPLLVLSEGSAPGLAPKDQPVAIQAFLDRTQSDMALAVALRRFRPEAPKLTTEDIFGDLLEDLERPPSTSLTDPFGLFPQPPAPLPIPQAPLSAAALFGGAQGGIEARSLAVPEQGKLPTPTVKVAPLRKPEAEPGPSEGEGGSQPPSEFTLSGISGVNDPFAWEAMAPAPAPAPAVVAPQPKAEVPAASEAIEEYGNYFLLEKIAVGGMAELFKAQQRGVQGFQKIVAIKRILPHFSDNEDFVTMFIDEAKLAAQLTHPNIVQIFDLGKAGSSYYIAMEYVNGRDLRTLLKKVREYGQPFPEQVAAFVVMKVAAALDYAHRKRGFDDRELKLVHRDISPQNVLLSTEGAVKLVDFGIAKAASKASHTVAGALKGKLLYMSPEQALGQPVDNRSDLYSLGLVLFELLTGERCFQADSEFGVLEKVRLGRVSDIQYVNPRVSKEMAGIVSRALQKGVDHRYPSARFLERDLRDYLQRQGRPIAEHDVAEYMTTLLSGSREDLEALVAARFPAPIATPALTSGAHRVGQPLGASSAGTTKAPVRDVVVELPPEVRIEAPPRPRWLLPVILGLAVLIVGLLLIAGWS
jgi:hypothetical protein